MLVNVVTIFVKPQFIQAFIDATVKNHIGTRGEPGNDRFDVIQSKQDPARFMLYEVFASEAAVEAHRQTVHYLSWRAAVEPMMAKTRELHSYQIIAPVDPEAW